LGESNGGMKQSGRGESEGNSERPDAKEQWNTAGFHG
jgi:hypothetical protein